MYAMGWIVAAGLVIAESGPKVCCSRSARRLCSYLVCGWQIAAYMANTTISFQATKSAAVGHMQDAKAAAYERGGEVLFRLVKHLQGRFIS